MLVQPGMPALMTVVTLAGAAIGALVVAIPAMAVDRGAPELSGVLIAAVSVGGVLGAILYGARHWRSRPGTRMVALMLVFGLSVSPIPALASWVAIGGLLALNGAALNPVLTTASLLVDELSPSAEAFGWMSTAIGVGSAAGSALAGLLGEHSGPGGAILLTTVACCVGAAITPLVTRGSS